MTHERLTLDAQPYVFVERAVPYGPEIGPAMEAAFGAVFGFVREKGIQPLSMPIAVYTAMEPNTLRFRAGVFVSAVDAQAAEEPVLTDVLPACDAIKVTHTGPYDRLSDTHQALEKHMDETGLNAAMPVWEVYVDDPGEIAPGALRTEVYRAIG